jgi:hypothetical protein
MKGGGIMTPEIFTIIVLIGAPALVWIWKKFLKPLVEKAGKVELIAAIYDGIQDGDLTEAEAKRILDEIKKLISKK